VRPLTVPAYVKESTLGPRRTTYPVTLAVGLAVHDNETSGRRTRAWQSLVAVRAVGGAMGGGGGSVVEVVVGPLGDRTAIVVVGIDGIETAGTVVVEPETLAPALGGGSPWGRGPTMSFVRVSLEPAVPISGIFPALAPTGVAAEEEAPLPATGCPSPPPVRVGGVMLVAPGR
jgi:hypothetical protein